MKETVKLIDYLNGFLNSIIEMDDEGTGYFPKSAALPQEELATLASLVDSASKEAADNAEQRVWEIYQKLTSEGNLSPKERMDYAKKNAKFFEENY